MLNVLSTQMMFNRTVNFASVLVLLLAVCRKGIASCSDGQYLSDGSCFNCTICAPNEVVEQCSNTSDTVCSRPSCGELQYLQDNVCINCTVCAIVEKGCTNTSDTVCSRCRDFEVPNAGGGCDFNCDKCRPNGVCNGRGCQCNSGYEGVTCSIRKPVTIDSSTPTVRSTPDPDEDGNRIVLIVCIVVASVVALGFAIAVIIIYFTCSKRSSQDSENSDDSTYSSASINSRTMLTNAERGSNASLQQHHNKQMSNGFRSSILPPPESWNNSIASAIK